MKYTKWFINSDYNDLWNNSSLISFVTATVTYTQVNASTMASWSLETQQLLYMMEVRNSICLKGINHWNTKPDLEAIFNYTMSNITFR